MGFTMKYLLMIFIYSNLYADDNSHGFFNGNALLTVRKDPITGAVIQNTYNINMDTEDVKDKSSIECANEDEMNDCYTTRLDTVNSLSIVLDERKTVSEEMDSIPQIELESAK